MTRSGFRTVWLMSPAIRQGRATGSQPPQTMYDLSADDARRWHQNGSHQADGCWCATPDPAFIDRLAERLRAAAFTTPKHCNYGDRLVLSGGPGFAEQDDTPLRRSIENA
jgi:hypothetical protein